MVNLSNFCALFEKIKEDESFKKLSNLLYKKFDISLVFEIENSFKRDISGSGQLFELNKYKFLIEGQGKLPFINSNDVYIIDSSIHLKYKFFKEKNADHSSSNLVFYNYSINFEKDEFIKYWKEKIVDGEMIMDIDDKNTYNESDYILPLFHCKLVSKKQLRSKWKMEIIEI